MTTRIPTTLLSGYLGSGKTTVINRLLVGIDNRRIAVLVNDFGAINIDASLIRNKTDQTVSLTNGCVCCSIADDLGAALDAQIKRCDPAERIIIEASGVAETARLAKHIGGWPGIELDTTVCVVDAETIKQRISDKFVGSLVRRQLNAADILILNKMDLVSADGGADIGGWLRRQAPQAEIVGATFGAIDPNLLVTTEANKVQSTVKYDMGEINQSPRFTSTVWMSRRSIKIEALQRVLNDLPESLHRLKGFVLDSQTDATLLVQLAGRRFSITDAGASKSFETKQHACHLVLVDSCDKENLRALCDRLDACVVKD